MLRVRVKGDEGEWGVEGEGSSEARGINGRLRVMLCKGFVLGVV